MTRRLAALLLVAAFGTACGSTVHVSGTDTPTGPSGLGTGTTGEGLGSTGGAGVGTTGTTAGTTGSTQLPGTTGTAEGAATGRAAVPGTTGLVPGAVGPGVTATTIALGLPYAVNAQAAAAALGASGEGVGGGNGRRQWEIILKDVNARGGVLGRTLVPIYHEQDSTDQTPLAQREEQACSHWTQDHKVFAVIAPEADPGETMLQCVHRAGAAQVYVDLTRSDDRTFAKYPYYLEAGTLRMDRMAAAWPGSLARQGWFGKWNARTGSPGVDAVKVGVVSFGDPTTVRAVQQFLKPALARVGHPLAEENWVRVSYPEGAGDNGGSISEIQGATLRFASAGVTHVLPFDSQGAGIGAFFATGAESQRYYPRYGLNTGVGAQTAHDVGLWPGSQLRGAMGYGWLPLIDLRFADNPDKGPYSSDSRRSCVNLMARHGEDMSNALVQRQAIAKCDEIRFLKQALEAGGAPSREALVLGAHRLGTRFASGLTFATRYDAAHHDGAAAARDFSWNEGCGCFRYSSGVFRLP